MTRINVEFTTRRQHLRTAAAVASAIVLAVIVYVLVRASLNPGPLVRSSPRSTVSPSSTHLPIPTVPPLRIPPVEPR